MLLNILYSFLGSTILLFLSLFIYKRLAKHYSKIKANAECWWLPEWNCWRFVIKNTNSKDTLNNIKYRTWFRHIKPATSGSSVKSFVDKDLIAGERIILPKDQDLPIFCFRVEEATNKLVFIHTDKLGEPIDKYTLTSNFDAIMIEFQLKIVKLGIIKFEIIREFTLPARLQLNQCPILTLAYFMTHQANEEKCINLFYQSAEAVSSHT